MKKMLFLAVLTTLIPTLYGADDFLGHLDLSGGLSSDRVEHTVRAIHRALQNPVIKAAYEQYAAERESTHRSIQDLLNDEKTKHLFTNHEGTLQLSERGIHSLKGLENVPHPETVTEIDLYVNQITRIPAGIFARFTKLAGIGLDRNPIVHAVGIFDGLTSLHGYSLDSGSETLNRETKEYLDSLFDNKSGNASIFCTCERDGRTIPGHDKYHGMIEH